MECAAGWIDFLFWSSLKSKMMIVVMLIRRVSVTYSREIFFFLKKIVDECTKHVHILKYRFYSIFLLNIVIVSISDCNSLRRSSDRCFILDAISFAVFNVSIRCARSWNYNEIHQLNFNGSKNLLKVDNNYNKWLWSP